MSDQLVMAFAVPIDARRVAHWERVLGTSTIPITSEDPEPAVVLGAARWVYWVDQARLTPEQLESMLRDLVERFEMSLEEGRRALPEGVPILAEGLLIYVVGAWW
jgi:benzoyl-CoA reductase/2-hydroxyglutaryl-CoA dehydratase subunit BcrC/BadD/HgdB